MLCHYYSLLNRSVSCCYWEQSKFQRELLNFGNYFIWKSNMFFTNSEFLSLYYGVNGESRLCHQCIPGLFEASTIYSYDIIFIGCLCKAYSVAESVLNSEVQLKRKKRKTEKAKLIKFEQNYSCLSQIAGVYTMSLQSKQKAAILHSLSSTNFFRFFSLKSVSFVTWNCSWKCYHESFDTFVNQGMSMDFFELFYSFCFSCESWLTIIGPHLCSVFCWIINSVKLETFNMHVFIVYQSGRSKCRYENVKSIILHLVWVQSMAYIVVNMWYFQDKIWNIRNNNSLRVFAPETAWFVTMRILRGRWKSVLVFTMLFPILYGIYRLYYKFEKDYADRESPYMKVSCVG